MEIVIGAASGALLILVATWEKKQSLQSPILARHTPPSHMNTEFGTIIQGGKTLVSGEADHFGNGLLYFNVLNY